MKITPSLLATTVVAMENAVDTELTALFQGCASLVNSPTFDGKHRPRLSGMTTEPNVILHIRGISQIST